MTDSRYKAGMQRVKAAFETRQKKASREKGLLIVYTGAGKGKSTAAFGMLLRAVHHGMKVGVVQFIKAAPSGEALLIEKAFGASVEWHRMGRGFTWETQDRDVDQMAARSAWARSAEFILARPDLGLVILDELNVALDLGQLALAPVLEILKKKPARLHVVVTGRGAPKELIDAADLVTEMRLIKHPYATMGIRAQPGIEF